jgi:hypothetical protein
LVVDLTATAAGPADAHRVREGCLDARVKALGGEDTD